MAHTVFVDGVTTTANRIVAAWLNDADTVTYVRFGDGTNYTGNLTVPGTTALTGTLTATTINASGTVAMAGAATVGTTLVVSGVATFQVGPAISGTLGITNTANTMLDALTVLNASAGNAASTRISLGNNTSGGAGQIILYGGNHATLPNYMDVTNANNALLRFQTGGGAASFGGTLSVTGTSTMAAINASGNISLTRSGATSADITLESGSGNSGLFLKTGGDLRAYIVHDAAANKLAIVGSNTGMGVDIYAGAEAGPYLSISSAGAVTIPGTLAFGSGTAGTVGSWTSSTGSSKTGFFYADATYAGISTGSAQTGQGLVLTATAVTLMVANSGVLTATAGSSSTSGIQLNAYTTNGTVTTTGSTGILSSASDATLKTHDGFVVNPLDMLAGLKARYYFWNHELGKEEPAQRQLGFFAQDVNEHLGDEAANPPKGDAKWGYYDRSVLAVAVEAIKELAAEFQSYKSSHP